MFCIVAYAFFERVERLIRKANVICEKQKDICEEVALIRQQVDVLNSNQHDITDIVDKAAKQYQEEISSLFSYCGETEGVN